MLVSLLLIGSSIASLSEYGGAGACVCEVRGFECEPGANWSHSILRSLLPSRFGDGKGVSSCFLVNETEEFIWKNFQKENYFIYSVCVRNLDLQVQSVL